MNYPQSGIFSENTAHSHVLEYVMHKDADIDQLRQALSAVIDYDDNNLSAAVIAFGAGCWQRLQPDNMPDELYDFPAKQSAHLSMPSTQGDIFIWAHGDSHSAVLERVMDNHRQLADHASLQLDQPGYRFKDSRDLTGFVDGSANPPLSSRHQETMIAQNLKGGAGSYILSQRWLHNLQEFHQLEQSEQERIIGRTKVDSIELEADVMPDNSHVSRTDVKIDGVGMKMFRRSFIYGTPSVHGMYFLAFCCSMKRYDIIIDRMLGLGNNGPTDRLMEFSTPQTGSYWFAPSFEDLFAAVQVNR